MLYTFALLIKKSCLFSIFLVTRLFFCANSIHHVYLVALFLGPLFVNMSFCLPNKKQRFFWGSLKEDIMFFTFLFDTFDKKREKVIF